MDDHQSKQFQGINDGLFGIQTDNELNCKFILTHLFTAMFVDIVV